MKNLKKLLLMAAKNNDISRFRSLLAKYESLLKIKIELARDLDKINEPDDEPYEKILSETKEGEEDLINLLTQPKNLELIGKLFETISKILFEVYTLKDKHPLRESIRQEFITIIENLIAKNLKINLLGIKFLGICLAAKYGDTQLLDLLIKMKFSLELRLEEKTAIFLAAEQGYLEAFQLLYAAKVQIKNLVFPSWIKKLYVNVLHVAADGGHAEICDWIMQQAESKNMLNARTRPLLEDGRDNPLTTRTNWTPLMLAVSYRRVEVVRTLLKNPHIDFDTKIKGTTLLKLAFENCRMISENSEQSKAVANIVQLLIARGYNLAQDASGFVNKILSFVDYSYDITDYAKEKKCSEAVIAINAGRRLQGTLRLIGKSVENFSEANKLFSDCVKDCPNLVKEFICFSYGNDFWHSPGGLAVEQMLLMLPNSPEILQQAFMIIGEYKFGHEDLFAVVFLEKAIPLHNSEKMLFDCYLKMMELNKETETEYCTLMQGDSTTLANLEKKFPENFKLAVLKSALLRAIFIDPTWPFTEVAREKFINEQKEIGMPLALVYSAIAKTLHLLGNMGTLFELESDKIAISKLVEKYLKQSAAEEIKPIANNSNLLWNSSVQQAANVTTISNITTDKEADNKNKQEDTIVNQI